MNGDRPPPSPAAAGNGHRPDGPDLRGLLTIDVAAELRKLSQAQLQGPWQLPAELVRRAIRAGARRVDVTFGRHEVVVSDDGAGLDPTCLAWTAALLEPHADRGRNHRDDDRRHEALTNLESAGELALLAVAGLEDLRLLDLVCRRGPHHHRLTFRRGGAPTVTTTAAGDSGVAAGGGTRITVRSPALDRARAIRWLTDVARFAPIRVSIDGTPIEDAMAAALLQAPLHPPLRGKVALAPARDAAHVDLLAFGLVVAHITLPGNPGFEAALEMGTATGTFSPAHLRETSLAQVPALADQALTLLISAARQLHSPDDPRRAALARLVLQAARRGGRRTEIDLLPVFRAVDADRAVLIDLATLTRLATAASRHRAAADSGGLPSLLALSPGERPQDHAPDPQPVLIADDAERSLLAEVLQVRFRTPSRRASRHSVGATIRRSLHACGRALGRLGDRLKLTGRQPALPDDVLTSQERDLLAALRTELRARPGHWRDAVICAGVGPLRRVGGRVPTLFLPRENPTVVASVRAFAADPGWLRLIHPALIAGPGGGQRSAPAAVRLR